MAWSRVLMSSLYSYKLGPLAKQTSLSNEPGEAPAYPWAACSSLPAHKMIQTSPPHSPSRTRRHSTFLWVCPHSPQLFVCYRLRLPCGMQCPFPLGSGCIWLINFCGSYLSSDSCHVFIHCYIVKVRISASPKRWLGGTKTSHNVSSWLTGHFVH